VIDLHCHVLPGIDDGPQTFEQSVHMARLAADAGVRTMVATPHVSWDYPNRAVTIAELVAALNVRLAEEDITLDVRGGAEIAVTRISDLDNEEIAALSLGGGPWLLVEPPFVATVLGLDTLFHGLLESGRQIVRAHPERCPAFQRDHPALHRLVDAGVACSITAGSLVGRFGGEVRRQALEFVREGLVHNVASDAHDDRSRPPGLAHELEQAGLKPLTEWVTEAVPTAILNGDPLPAAPPFSLPPRARRPWWRLSR
jgi:protein-tyrosine phosphatase